MNFNTQATYTQGNGTSSGVFVANNGVHEYLSQADVLLGSLADVTLAELLRRVAAA